MINARKNRILILEDRLYLSNLIKFETDFYNIHPSKYSDVRKALQLMRTNIHLNLQLIMIDLYNYNKINVYVEFIRSVRVLFHCKDIPIVVVNEFYSKMDTEKYFKLAAKFMNCGDCFFFIKERIGKEEIRFVLDTHLKRRPMGPSKYVIPK